MIRSPMHASLVALVLSVGFVAGAGGLAFGCAQADANLGDVADKCSLRDCGPTSGGGDTSLEPDLGNPEDAPIVPKPDSGPGKDDSTTKIDSGIDDSTPGSDTGTAPDAEAGADTTPPPPIDTGTDTPTTPTCSPPAPSGHVCGTLPQCGCPGTDNCDVTKVDGSTSCVASGATKFNQPCTTLGECAKGLSCVAGLCLPFCNGTPDCAAETGGALCEQVMYVPTGSTTAAPVPGFMVCMQQCDPRSPSAICGTGNGCGFIDNAKGITTCSSAGTATTAGSCSTDPLACAPGYVCVNGATAGTSDCDKWCRVGHPTDCTSPKKCLRFVTPPMFGTTEYGVCG